MDESYDVIILGTGLSECILSGILSVEGKKVLHMDRNRYYGGESASINPINNLFEHFKRPVPADMNPYGRLRDWNVDLIPKLLMADGKLVKTLISTGVTRYLEFKLIEGSYVYVSGGGKKQGKVHKVPASESEALKSDLMGLFEKRHFAKFLTWVLDFDVKDQKTWKPFTETTKMDEVYAHFKLDPQTIDFTGHAIALHRDESYRSRPFLETVQRAQLYYGSLMRYVDQDKKGASPSPYLYCLYGLGELPQSFARLSAIYGGTYMLDTDVTVEYEDGHFSGVRSKDGAAKAPMVIGDPSYFPDKVEKVGKVVRAICLLDHPIPDTNNAHSLQMILPASQLNRSTDIYVCCMSHNHEVAPKGHYIAVVGATVETGDPEAEIKSVLHLLGPLMTEPFVYVADLYKPTDMGHDSKVFITSSYDATTHFETTCEDIENVYERCMGKKLDLEFLNSRLANPAGEVTK